VESVSDQILQSMIGAQKTQSSDAPPSP